MPFLTLTLPNHLIVPALTVPVAVVAKLTVVLLAATTSNVPSYVPSVVPVTVMVLPTGYGLGTAFPALVNVKVAIPVDVFAVPVETEPA